MLKNCWYFLSIVCLHIHKLNAAVLKAMTITETIMEEIMEIVTPAITMELKMVIQTTVIKTVERTDVSMLETTMAVEMETITTVMLMVE